MSVLVGVVHSMNRFQRRRAQRRARHHTVVQQTRQHVHSRATLWLRLLARLLRVFR
jgi:hypothetical protein